MQGIADLACKDLLNNNNPHSREEWFQLRKQRDDQLENPGSAAMSL